MGFKLKLTAEESKAAQGGGFPVLPAGTYGAVIQTNKQGKSKSSGNEMFTIDFKIKEAPEGVTATNRRQRGWFTLEGKGLFNIIGLHKAIGFDYPGKDFEGEFEWPEAAEYLGEEVLIVLDVEEYESVDPDTDEDVTLERNTLKRVLKYDEDKIALAGAERAESKGMFL